MCFLASTIEWFIGNAIWCTNVSSSLQYFRHLQHLAVMRLLLLGWFCRDKVRLPRQTQRYWTSVPCNRRNRIVLQCNGSFASYSHDCLEPRVFRSFLQPSRGRGRFLLVVLTRASICLKNKRRNLRLSFPKVPFKSAASNFKLQTNETWRGLSLKVKCTTMCDPSFPNAPGTKDQSNKGCRARNGFECLNEALKIWEGRKMIFMENCKHFLADVGTPELRRTCNNLKLL